MSTNTSLAFTATPWPLLLSQDQAAKLSVAFKFAIIPGLSAVEICGNVLSMFLLTRQGFRKSSNVLLFGLALAFSLHVQTGNNPVSFSFSQSVNYMFYIFYMTLLGTQYIGLFGSILITVLITVDRLIVIFLPLTAHTVVTPLRTLLVITCFSSLIIGCFIYQYLLSFMFEQVHLVGGVVLGRIVPTERLDEDLRSGVYWLFLETLNYFTGIVPMVFVTLGCAVIGLKVTFIIKRRKVLTSGGATSINKHSSRRVLSKTTRTLVLICIVYIVCNSFGFIVLYVVRIPILQNENYILNVLDVLGTFSQCINSVANFIIYVAANDNFTYENLRRGYFVKRRRG